MQLMSVSSHVDAPTVLSVHFSYTSSGQIWFPDSETSYLLRKEAAPLSQVAGYQHQSDSVHKRHVQRRRTEVLGGTSCLLALATIQVTLDSSFSLL